MRKVQVFARVIMLTAGLAVLVPARPVRANGAFPDSDAVLLPADRPQQIGLSTNFGLIISDDGGASWQWTCERAETSMATAYALGAPPGDRLYSLSLDVGLAFSDDDSCSWRRAGGALADRDRDRLLSRSDRCGARARDRRRRRRTAGTGAAAVHESTDGGDSFAAAPLYVAGAGAELLGVEIARADPRVIYLAIADARPAPDARALGRRGRDLDDAGHRAVARRAPARIIAIDPVDPDVVYLRVIGAGVELLAVSRDGGVSFATPITLAGGALSAFARLASGTVLVAGLMPGDGGRRPRAWRGAPIDGGVTFEDWALSPVPRLRALGERDGTLYLAGSNYMDGWALAVSSDEGRTIQPIARYDQVSAVKACVAAVCQELCDEQAGRENLGARGLQPAARRRRGRGPADGLATAVAAARPRRAADAGIALRCWSRLATALRSAARRRRRGTAVFAAAVATTRPDRRAGAGVDEHDQAVGSSRTCSPSSVTVCRRRSRRRHGSRRVPVAMFRIATRRPGRAVERPLLQAAVPAVRALSAT